VTAIKNICALGTGTMGAGTALCFALAGYDVQLYGRSEASLAKGIQSIQTSLASFQAHDMIDAANVSLIMRRIQGTTSLEQAAKNADFVIESIVEDLAAKQQIFAALETICPSQTIFATNTSGLSPTRIAETIDRKDKFVVTHFWNPPQLIPLVEIVPGQHTAQATVDTAFQLMQALGKKLVTLRQEAPGFIGNRIQLAILRESFHLVATEVASPEALDTAIKHSLGRELATVGPMASMGRAGEAAVQSLFAAIGSDLCNDQDVPLLLQQSVQAGRLGAKTKAGIYQWTPETLAALRGKREDSLFAQLLHDAGKIPTAGGNTQLKSPEADSPLSTLIEQRIQAAIWRESAHIVATNIASAEAVDTVVQYSLGRRLSTTGPLESADLGGLDVFRSIFSYLGRDLSNNSPSYN